MTETDYSYFTRRAAEERAISERSQDPVARGVHLDLATRLEAAAAAALNDQFETSRALGDHG